MSEDWKVDIESRLAHQEDLLDQLNSVLAGQQRELDELRRANQLLFKKLTELEESRQDAHETKHQQPPHY